MPGMGTVVLGENDTQQSIGRAGAQTLSNCRKSTQRARRLGIDEEETGTPVVKGETVTQT